MNSNNTSKNQIREMISSIEDQDFYNHQLNQNYNTPYDYNYLKNRINQHLRSDNTKSIINLIIEEDLSYYPHSQNALIYHILSKSKQKDLVLDTLKSIDFDFNKPINNNGDRLIHKMSIHGDHSSLKKLVDLDVDINIKNNIGNRAIDVAMRYGNDDAIRILDSKKDQKLERSDIQKHQFNLTL